MTIPFDDITSFGQQTMLDRNVFNISWILGRFCNYNCSYCWPHARSDKIDYQDHSLYINSINKIKQQARANGFNAFHWSFSGGEPTAYKQLNDLVKHLDETESSYQSIHMTTNLSPGSKWWKTWCSNTEMLQRRSITASFHDEFAKEQEFGDKCLQLQYELVHVTINQVMVPEKFDELYERCQRFSDKGINVTLKPQSNETASEIVKGYSDAQIELMKTGFPQKVKDDEVYQVRLTDGLQNYFLDQAERFNAFNFNKFFGWHCNAGYQSLIIRGNEVKRGYSCQDTPLGTLSDGFEIFKTPVKCVTPSCVSSADSKIPKRK
jgi:organic radical activating enzyme